MRDLASRKCDVLIGSGYKWRIGDWRPYLQYAVNFHPSPLPEARGPYPNTQALLERRTEWGVSCHKFDKNFDTGDILCREIFPLNPHDCHELLVIKIQLALRRLASKLSADFHSLWENAQPQGNGSYWPLCEEKEWTLDFSQPVDEVMRIVSAFGVLGSLGVIDGKKIIVQRAFGWTEAHTYTPGTIVRKSHQNIVVAVPDGYIAIIQGGW